MAINQKLADLYVENKNFDKAIEAKKKVLKENFVKENSQEKVNQIQELADIYIKKNDPKEAVDLLKTHMVLLWIKVIRLKPRRV